MLSNALVPAVSHVVLLEDDPVQRSLQQTIWADVVRDRQIQVHVAPDAPTADELVDQLDGPALLVFDHDVPGGSGLASLQRARSQVRHAVLCVLFTASTDIEGTPGIEIIIKPAQFEDWRAIAATLMQKALAHNA